MHNAVSLCVITCPGKHRMKEAAKEKTDGFITYTPKAAV